MIDLDWIRAATNRIAPYIRRTPALQIGPQRWLKLECLQHIGAYKVRGFFATALTLPSDQLRRGLCTLSAGNAALAAAYAAKALGVSCRVFMFDNASTAKLEGVKRLGATPVLRPREELLEWLEREGWRDEPETFIHPFAGEETIAGHGSLGLELLQDVPDLARVVIPVGGGGLISGVASALKALKPEVQVIGVQSSGYALYPRTFAAGGQPPHLTPQTIADGTAGPFDPVMYQRMKQLVDGWLEVPEAELRSAVAALALSHKVIAEGAGALPFAALAQLPEDRPTVAVISGGNIAAPLLAEILTTG